MRALTWHGKNDIRCDTVPDPKIEHGRDAIIKVTACAICGSDLHLFDGVMPSMEKGDVLGHETMGDVVEVGSENQEAQGRLSRRGSIYNLLRRAEKPSPSGAVALSASSRSKAHFCLAPNRSSPSTPFRNASP
jgi:NADPH:quinone reductase-like Zn-dependent oxidoreductase